MNTHKIRTSVSEGVHHPYAILTHQKREHSHDYLNTFKGTFLLSEKKKKKQNVPKRVAGLWGIVLEHGTWFGTLDSREPKNGPLL